MILLSYEIYDKNIKKNEGIHPTSLVLSTNIGWSLWVYLFSPVD